VFGQRSQLWYHLPADDTFELLARIYEQPAAVHARRKRELVELFAIGDLLRKPVRQMSLGERMRCEVVASLLHRPEILFLDEPTIGLDLIAKTRFRDLILRLNEERATTIFLTSHDVSDIEQVARRVIVINHGQLIYDDRVSRMRRDLLRTRLIDVRFETPPAELAIDGATLVKLSGPGAKLEVDTEQRSIRAVLDDLLDRYDVAGISVTEPPLEDVITHIYGQSPA
jgi:ABC-2 type transport system ATP-binding protein